MNLIEDLDCKNCILKVLNIQSNNVHFVLTTDTKGFIRFWDISKYIETSNVKSTFTPKYKHRLHQSGINCCDWLQLKNNYSLLTTGGDDQSLSLTIFHSEDIGTLVCNASISLHCSQVTGNFYLFMMLFKLL